MSLGSMHKRGNKHVKSSGNMHKKREKHMKSSGSKHKDMWISRVHASSQSVAIYIQAEATHEQRSNCIYKHNLSRTHISNLKPEPYI